MFTFQSIVDHVYSDYLDTKICRFQRTLPFLELLLLVSHLGEIFKRCFWEHLQGMYLSPSVYCSFTPMAGWQYAKIGSNSFPLKVHLLVVLYVFVFCPATLASPSYIIALERFGCTLCPVASPWLLLHPWSPFPVLRSTGPSPVLVRSLPSPTNHHAWEIKPCLGEWGLVCTGDSVSVWEDEKVLVMVHSIVTVMNTTEPYT